MGDNSWRYANVFDYVPFSTLQYICFLKCGEYFPVQELAPQLAVERFNIGVLAIGLLY